MTSERRNTYLDAGFSDESDQDAGYDSEAAEVSKAGRASKRRKIEHESSDEEELVALDLKRSRAPKTSSAPSAATTQPLSDDGEDGLEDKDENENVKHIENEGLGAEANMAAEDQPVQPSSLTSEPATTEKKSQTSKSKSKSKSQQTTPGVVYLSSLPPYLKPSALRNLLEQRGFSPIKRLFLSPASRHAHGSKKNSRQLYTEGWIEFSSKKVARRCAETLNATTVGGRKGGWYRDDVWNMKYLKGMGWEELMAGVREEKREEEGRRDEERRIIARDTKRFIEGVEEGRRVEGIKRKKAARKGEGEEAANDAGGEAAVDVRRTWRQTEVKGKTKGQDTAAPEKISDDVKQVLNRIF